MAREETDREDLLREATALVERIELASIAENITAGFRANGAFSIFFGADRVYQFNPAGELRRAFVDGLLYKAERGRLVTLERVRTTHEVQLVRRDVSPAAEARFLTQMNARMQSLAAQLQAGAWQIIGQVPDNANVLDRMRTWLAGHSNPQIANSPRVSAT